MAFDFEAFNLYGSITVEVGESGEVLLKLRRQAKSADDELERLAKQAVNTANAFRRMGDSFNQKEAAGAAKAFQDIKNNLKNLSPQDAARKISEATVNLKGLNSELLRQRTIAAQNGNEQSILALLGISGVNPAIIATTAAVAGLATVVQQSNQALQTAATYQQAENGLIRVSQSAEGAKEKIAELEKVASDTQGLRFLQAIEAQRNLEAAKIESELATRSIAAFANSLAIVGGGEAEFKGVLLALTQIASKSKISAEEINQLAERIPQIRTVIQAIYGTSDSEVLQKRGIDPKDFIAAVTAELEKLPKAQGNATGAWENFTDAVEKSYAIVGKPALPGVARSLEKLTGVIDDNEEVFESWGASLATTVSGVEKVIDVVDYLSDVGLVKLLKYGRELTYFSTFFGKTVNTLGSISGLSEYLNFGVKIQGDLSGSLTNFAAAAGKLQALPDIAGQLQAEKAEKELKSLQNTVLDLTDQYAYFGDESEVAATKQKLINQGVYDFSSALAQNALQWAAVIDRQKEAAKKQQEYNAKLKAASDYMTDLREKADFNTRFPDATPLQQFDFWAEKNAGSFKELTSQIEFTRAALAHEEWMKSWKSLTDASNAAFASLDKNLIDLSRKSSELTNPLEDFARRINLVGAPGQMPDVIASEFSRDVEAFLKRIDSTEEQIKRLQENALGIDVNSDAYIKSLEAVKEAHTEAIQSYRQYLTVLESRAPSGETFQLFGREEGKTLSDFADKIRAIRDAAADERLKSALIETTALIDGLSQAAVENQNTTLIRRLEVNLDSELFKGQRTQIVDELAKAERERALLEKQFALNRIAQQKAEALKRVEGVKNEVELAAKINDAFRQYELTEEEKYQQKLAEIRNQYLPKRQEAQQKDALDDAPAAARGFFEGISIEKFTTDADAMASTMERLGQIGADSFNSLAQAIGSTVEQWALYGNLSGENAKKAVASALAAASAQSAVSAIMETAYGIAALTPWGRLLYGDPSLHFKSAALFAAVALGTAGLGRAVAGDSFKKDSGGYSGSGSSNQNQPDYYTAPPQNYNPQSLQSNDSGLKKEVANLAIAVSSMNAKMDTMEEGVLFKRGADKNPGLFGERAFEDMKRSPGLAVNLGKTITRR